MRKSRDFTVYFPNLKGNLLEVDLDIHSEKGGVKIAGTGLLGPGMQHTMQFHVRRSTRDCERWDEMTEHAKNGLFYFGVLKEVQ